MEEGEPKGRLRFRDLIGKESTEQPPTQSSENPGSGEQGEAKPSEPKPGSPPEKLKFTDLSEVSERVKPGAMPSEPQKQKEVTIPEQARQGTSDPKVLYDRVYRAASIVYKAAADGGRVDLRPLRPLSEELADNLSQAEPDVVPDARPKATFYRKVMVATEASLDWPAHAIHVATLAAKLGTGLGYTMEALANLAMAGLAHDLGMMLIPKSILETPGPVTSKERSVIQTHPIRAAELIDSLGPEYDWIKTVVLQEHERYQGQGYPHGISGKDIDEFARIIGLVDCFVAMTQPRPWRPPMMPHDAAKELIYVRKDEFDPAFIKVFLKKVSIFPINSLVRLSNNEVAQILAVHEDSPMRPTIEILQPSRGKQLTEPKIMDLRSRPLIYITGSVSDAELVQHTR